MSIQDIKSGILRLDGDGLDCLINTINYRRKEINQKIKSQFNVGDNVWFYSKDNKVEGKITKINRKYIVVKENEGWTQWNVSPSLLKKEK